MKRAIYLSLIVLVSFFLLGGCVVPVIYAVKYIKDKDKVTLTIQTEGNAHEIFDASVRSNKSKFPENQVIEENRDKLIYEGKRVMKDGSELWFRWQTKQLSEGMTMVELEAKGSGMKEKVLEEYAVNAIQAFCTEIGKHCEITK